jgi:phosphotransferase system  glucose/maltose/N-acetylglucosamine-specific IIC component
MGIYGMAPTNSSLLGLVNSMPDIMNGTVDPFKEIFSYGFAKDTFTGINPGQYMQGKYSFMIFGLPAAGAAMVMAADKENRKAASAIIVSAAFTAFVTGITEPIEFTFLFLAP